MRLEQHPKADWDVLAEWLCFIISWLLGAYLGPMVSPDTTLMELMSSIEQIECLCLLTSSACLASYSTSSFDVTHTPRIVKLIDQSVN